MNKHFIARVLAVLLLLMMAYTAGVYLKPVEAGGNAFSMNGWYLGGKIGLFTDNRTGCQYIYSGSQGGTTPRLNMGGKPMCGFAK